jgi:diguanylate cyclase (GGDEF)-like protein/PAS domain S-box-containing protein
MAIGTAPGNVLVVDDHESMRSLLERVLRSQGHAVVTAANGREALALLGKHPIDLVVLDVMMPEMSGIEVLQHIKATPATHDIPVLVVSADTDTDKVVACINLGAEDYLVKPFNAVFVKARVTTCLERRRLHARERAYQLTLEQRVAERTALAEQRAEALERSQAELKRSEMALKRQTLILQSILNSMGDGVVVVDMDGELMHHNPAAQQILGNRLADLLPGVLGQAPTFRKPDQLTVYQPGELPLAQAVQGHDTDGMELFVAPAQDDSSGQWLSITARPLQEPQGALMGAVGVVRDVSAAKHAELALRESEERYALAARGANDGLWEWDLRTNQAHFSPRWKAMLGYAEDEIGTALAEWIDRVHPDDRERLEARLAAHHRRLISHFEHEYRIRHKDGSYRWMLCRGLAVWNESGRAMRMAGSQADVTDRRKFEQQLVHDALHDDLTGLPNRALFVDRLSHALSRMRRNPTYHFAVLFLDLDRFKLINDGLGHAIGDQLLITIARRLEQCLRPGDTAARLGGDEFTILLDEVHDEQIIREIADRAQQALSAPIQLGEQEVFTTASIGILLSSVEYESATDMIRDADTAMYRAKLAGKACSVLFDPAMHAQIMSHLHLEADLRWAIEREELCIHYQPIVELETGQIAGIEALVRWQHPQRGLLMPGAFLDVAEDSGLIVPLSWWVLRQACRQVRIWQQQIPGAQALWVSVNLSAKQLAQANVVTHIKEILESAGLASSSLKLEITEHTLVEHGEITTRVAHQIREIGVQLCIDDFGTGYSSLSYLHQLPVDVLKIDRSFISQMGQGGDRNEIVRTILGLARTLGMKAVAEGTETIQQADELRRLACDFSQGWLFSKALTAVDLEALMGVQPASR